MTAESLFHFDDAIRIEKGGLLCGVDEAGRGPLAGPVVCAAVVLDSKTAIDGLNDSKRMTERSRERVFDDIVRAAVSISVIFKDNNEIDRVNILEATMKAMREAVKTITVEPHYIIIDGNRTPDGLDGADSIVKGDSLSASIAAASVIAKVTRDRYMLLMDRIYPLFCFSKHKGYPTKLHYEMIKQHGITPLHRKSFLKGVL